jgi:ribosomal protein L20
MRIDRASSALTKVDLIQTLLLSRLLANDLFIQIDRKIITSDFAVFDDRFFCLTHFSFF